eukprot:TRINITY_DN3607_c0_g2_i2.p1 TRINITY_DN3607_c0_g2~~TRINITY_DN3607_c0_g2_i2.p1  ORF type:complete len:460 (+),score=89.76 TRINITY_DN3607_c0_g2_i2:239-1618(+)
MRRRELTDLFDKEFLDFGYWLRKEIGKSYTRKDFQQINKRESIITFIQFLVLIASYIALHNYANEHRPLWRYPLFALAIVIFQNEQMVHTRMHWAGDMTGCHAFDLIIDSSIMMLTGFSKEAFRRRHVDEHMAEISNVARLFGEAWLPFLDLPAIWYLRPTDLVRLLLDKKRCDQLEFSRSQILVEAISLHLYLFCLMFELYLGSNFLLCYHLCPMLLVMTARLMTGMFTHSGIDRRNSFNSCGLFDHRDAKGLFKVTIWWINLLTDWGLSNHSIHHGHAQCPISIINKRLRSINKFILENYKDVRYNRVLSHETHRDLLSRLPEPRWYDYVVQWVVTNTAMVLTSLTILGIDISPIIFELAMVDYRAFLYSTRAERYANYLALWDSMHFWQRSKAIPNPHHYMKFIKSGIEDMKKYLREHPGCVEPVPYRLYAPEWVYTSNDISLTPLKDHCTFDSRA